MRKEASLLPVSLGIMRRKQASLLPVNVGI